MPLPILIFLICFFKITIASTPTYIDYFILRNVGQGLWATRVQNGTCEHYDFGGEIFHARKLKRQFIAQCFNKLNMLHLSHTHEDHYAFLELIVKNSRSLCWSTRPPEPLKHEPPGIPFCRHNSTNQILFYDNEKTNKNDRSIVQIAQQFLIPGDSSIKMEKIWSEKLGPLNRPIKYLLVGHHGSRTATGDHLLTKLPAIKQAFVSARFQRYRHPHAETTKKLREHKVPLIKTEDWGDIRINY